MTSDDETTKTRLSLATRELLASHQATATLTMLVGPRVGYTHVLPARTQRIGRDSKADIYINHAGVSRQHAMIEYRDQQYILSDLRSTNGTYCRGQAVTGPVELRSGDQIGIADAAVFRFSLEDDVERELRAHLYELATKDPLTRAFNRSYFRERLDSEWPWAKRHERACALLMFDIDHFKQVNDTYGHAAGDTVLEELAGVVRRTIRAEDLFARLGGEEFCVLCRATDVVHAMTLAERLRKAVEGHSFEHREHRLSITVSIGVATTEDPEVRDPLTLIERADERLYRAKGAGRNRVAGPP